MIYRYRQHEVRELAWIFEGPGLLDADFFSGLIEPDSAMRERIAPYTDILVELDRDPSALLSFLSKTQTYNRLGRYFEALLRFYLLHLEQVPKLEGNIQIKDQRHTIGELDIVYVDSKFLCSRHWEASVKFYLCTTDDRLKAQEPRYFMGTLTQDRFDRKLDKLLKRQLTLPKQLEAEAKLKDLGFDPPLSHALLKGFFYYPSHLDWRHAPHPPEVSHTHARGWWTTSDPLVLPAIDENSHYVLLPPARWLAPFQTPFSEAVVFTRTQLETLVRNHFDGPETWTMLHREMMVAEVELIDEERDGRLWVRERSRGNILHPKWPKLAAAEAELPLVSTTKVGL